MGLGGLGFRVEGLGLQGLRVEVQDSRASDSAVFLGRKALGLRSKSTYIAGCRTHPEGPCTQLLGTWIWGNSNYSAGFGQVYNYWVLGPLGPSAPV